MSELEPNASAAPSAPSRSIVWTVGVLLVASLLMVAVFAYSYLQDARTAAQPKTAPLADFGEVPNFTLTERFESPISRDDLKGEIWIADFIFTYCAGPCPLMTAKMADVQKDLSVVPNVRLVSFSVDPERDTPERLREYASSFEADSTRWLFLTGPIETISMLTVDGFHMGVKDDPVLHSTLFALVDQRGHIRNYYHSDDPEMRQKLQADVATLLRDRRI